MSSTSATPPATRRIAKSYLTDLIAATPSPGNLPVTPVVDHLLERAILVRHVLRSDTTYAVIGSGGDPIDLDPPPVSLCVLNPSGVFFDECVQDEDGKAGGTWHWPERVEG